MSTETGYTLPEGHDPLFTGPTRPLMSFGVPQDFLILFAACILEALVLAMFIRVNPIPIVVGAVLVYGIVRAKTEQDAYFLRILRLWLVQIPWHINRWYWGCSRYEP